MACGLAGSSAAYEGPPERHRGSAALTEVLSHPPPDTGAPAGPQPVVIASSVLEALLSVGTPDRVRDLIHLFVQQSAETFASLAEAHALGEDAEIRRLAHDLFGTAASFGGVVVADLARRCEERGASVGSDTLYELRRAVADLGSAWMSHAQS